MKINRLYAFLTAFFAMAVSAIGISLSAEAAPQGKAIGYWNQARLEAAQPIELSVDETTGIGKLRVNAQAGKPSSKTKPGTTTVATTDWPQGSPIAQTAVGKVFFTVGTAGYVCSAALATDPYTDRAIVLTAAHCVWSQGTPGAFVTNFAFYPNYDAGFRQAWYASALVVRSEFATQTTFNTTALANDWAFAVLTPGGANPTNLPDVDFQGVAKNSYDLNIAGFTTGNTSYAFGYPAASPFDGQTLKYAGAPIFVDSNTKTTWGMASTMTGGASGGPWLSNGTSTAVNAVSGKLSSLNSYKYNTDSTKMYGPFFNSRTTATYNAALTAVGNQTVSG
jgi:hypothetical protein